MDGPYGTFVDEAYKTKEKLVLIVGGIGATPFLDLIEDIEFNPADYPEKIWMFYGSQDDKDIAFKSKLDNAMQKNPNFKCIYVLSKEKSKDPTHEFGFITADLLKKYLKDPLKSYMIYLCGPKIMTDSLKKILKKEKVTEDMLHVEEFSF